MRTFFRSVCRWNASVAIPGKDISMQTGRDMGRTRGDMPRQDQVQAFANNEACRHGFGCFAKELSLAGSHASRVSGLMCDLYGTELLDPLLMIIVHQKV